MAEDGEGPGGNQKGSRKIAIECFKCRGMGFSDNGTKCYLCGGEGVLIYEPPKREKAKMSERKKGFLTALVLCCVIAIVVNMIVKENSAELIQRYERSHASIVIEGEAKVTIDNTWGLEPLGVDYEGEIVVVETYEKRTFGSGTKTLTIYWPVR